MAFRTLFAVSVVALASGCSIQPIDDSPQPPRKDITGAQVSGGQDAGVDRCHFTLGKGCSDGHVVAKTTFLVDGKQFFDANDLGARFQDLLTVASGGKTLTSGGADGYRLTLATPVDDASFYEDFSYELTGPAASSGRLRNDGNFGIDDLPEGSYELRLAKPVRFTLSAVSTPAAPAGPRTTDGLNGTPPSAQTNPPAPTPVTPPAPTPTTPPTPVTPPATTAGTNPIAPTAGTTSANASATTTTTTPTAPVAGGTSGNAADQQPTAATLVTRSFCATLYVDATVEVRGGSRTYTNFGEYRLHVTNDQCSADGNVTSLTLTP